MNDYDSIENIAKRLTDAIVNNPIDMKKHLLSDLNKLTNRITDLELIQLKMSNNAKRARNHLKNNNAEMASFYINKITELEGVVIMKNLDKIEFHMEQLRLAYKNLAAQKKIVDEHEKALEEVVKESDILND